MELILPLNALLPLKRNFLNSDIIFENYALKYKGRKKHDGMITAYVYLSNKNIRMSNNKNMIWQ